LRDRFDVAAQAGPNEPLFLPLTALGELYKGVILAKVIRAVQFERLSDKSG